MKPKFETIFCAAAIAVAVVFAVQNRSLHTQLAQAEEKAALASVSIVSAGDPANRLHASPEAIDHAGQMVSNASEAGESVDQEEFDNAPSERVREPVSQPNSDGREERWSHRREWENATEEEREAHRREFRERMQAHANKQIADFEEKLSLDPEQCSAFEMELEAFDTRVREIGERFAVMVDGGVKFGVEMQARIMNEMSAAMLDAYDGLGEVLPEGWRENGGEFNVMFGISPGSLAPLFDALGRNGAFGSHGPGPFGPFHRGPKRP